MGNQEYTPSFEILTALPIADIAWLAGLLEGEGSFYFSRRPYLKIAMTDRDIIQRVATLCGGYSIQSYQPAQNPSYKRVWSLMIRGHGALRWMAVLFPWMGARRQTAIRAVFSRAQRPRPFHKSSASQALHIHAMPQFAWMAGLLEGEGYFSLTSSPCIGLQMTDQDIVQRAAMIADNASVTSWQRRNKPQHKKVWDLRLCGRDAAAWMMTIYPWMGERRQAKIRAVLQGWKRQPGFPRGSQGQRRPALCHPDRLRHGQGLCDECYQKKFLQTYVLETKAACHPERIVEAHGLCNACYLREHRARLAGKPSLLPPSTVERKPASCHPELRHYAKGLCQNCYQRQGAVRRKGQMELFHI